ncbi:MAG: hypothetical protein ACREQA_06990 [Candidatus Binatia bacterium]
MLQRLVPDGRTHRLAHVVAGMLQHASLVAYEKFGDYPNEGSAAQSLLYASEQGEPDEIIRDLSDIVEKLFEDAGVKYKRVNRRGDEYSVIESAIAEFVHWHNMPWESGPFY